MNHPEGARGAARRAVRSLPVWTAIYAGYAAVMFHLERRMHQAGGPGIIPLELAGTAAAAEAIMAQWGSEGRRAARLSLVLDFGYMLTYGVLTGLLLDRTARRSGRRRVAATLVVPAVVSDAVEGVALLRVLDHRDVERNARRARIAALIKFAVLTVCAGYLARFATPRPLRRPVPQAPRPTRRTTA